MQNKLLKNWLEKNDLSRLSLIDVLDAPLEISDENGVYYIEGLYIDDEGDLWGFGMDVDGGEIEVYNVTLPHDVELKIINWLSKQYIKKQIEYEYNPIDGLSFEEFERIAKHFFELGRQVSSLNKRQLK